MKQVKVYLDPKFNDNQMFQIRYGFHNGLTINQVKVYARSEFDADQMFEIRNGFEDGLTIKQVKFYAKPKFNGWQMCQIREFIKENNITDMSINTIKFLIGLNCI
jgi:hypothetical protein